MAFNPQSTGGIFPPTWEHLINLPNGTTNWDQIFKYLSLWGTDCHSTIRTLPILILNYLQLKQSLWRNDLLSVPISDLISKGMSFYKKWLLRIMRVLLFVFNDQSCDMDWITEKFMNMKLTLKIPEIRGMPHKEPCRRKQALRSRWVTQLEEKW